VYDGLLPEDFELQDAPQREFSSLPDATIVLVASKNYNTYVDIWREAYERGPPLPWVSEGNLAVARQASDPRHFADRIIGVLQQHFTNVRVATDFVEAREMGADYIAVVDYWTVWRAWAMRQRTRAGVHVLDSQLRQVMAIENQVDVPLVESPGLSVDRAWEASAQTMTNSLNEVSAPVLETLQQRLSAARHDNTNSQ